MRPLDPVLRLPSAVAHARPRRRGPAGLAVALALGLVAAASATGASPDQPPLSSADHSAIPPPAIPRPAPPVVESPLAAPPGTTSLVSLSANDGFANGASTSPSISENGRFVAFVSLANNIVPNDTNNSQDVFVRDRREGTTIRLPLPGGVAAPPTGKSMEPSISADGSTVAFTYVPPPPSTTITVPALSVSDCSAALILVWRRDTGGTEIGSLNADDGVHCGATSPSVSGDGRLVAFIAPVTNASGVPLTQVFVRDRIAGTTILASAANNGTVATSFSRAPAISQDGRFVAFESDASNLSSGDSNETSDVFLRALPNGPTELVSVAPGVPGNGSSNAPTISADGSVVAFQSGAQNLIAGLVPGARAVYVRDRAGGVTTLASVNTAGASASGHSGQASISADGRIVAFASVAQDLALGNAILAIAAPPPPTEIYAHDRVSGETIRISEARTGGPAGAFNVEPSVAGNGRLVAFASNSPNIVQGDGNQVGDVFLRDLPPAPSIAPDPVDFGARAVGAPGPPIAAIVTNSGWSPLTVVGVDRSGDAAGDYSVAFNGCDGRLLRTGESCPITIVFTPSASGDRIATLEVDHHGPRPPLTTVLRGSASNARIDIKPPVGRPGVVVVATGSGFPSGAEIGLAWSRGITPKLPPIVTDARGNFRVQVLVFHNDVIGRRDLVVTPSRGTPFAPFGTAFLVTEPPSVPPRFEPGDPTATRPITLIFRR